MTVPDDVTPDGVWLTVTAAQLRDGTDAEAVPGYEEQAWAQALARIADELTWGPFRRATDSRGWKGTHPASAPTA